ncbi:MAG: hypothetical protein H6570_14640 [Lewinellaceae bacterium]|nr:hypothetical protein [Lewinellaceae bacterium]
MKPKSKSDKKAYPHYPAKEDIYKHEEKVPLDVSGNPLKPSVKRAAKSSVSAPENQLGDSEAEQKENKRIFTDAEDDGWNEANFDEEHTGDDLDVPGSEEDDDQEDIGEEDEENNYYSLGGDRHDA